MKQYPEKPVSVVKNRPPLKKSGLGNRSINGGNIYNSMTGSPTKLLSNRLPQVNNLRGSTPGARGKGFKSVAPQRPPRANNA